MITLTRPRIDKPKLIGELLYIDNKDGVIVPFKFNRTQLYFHSHKTNRNIVLKARQLGISSSILADHFTDCITIPHTTCAVVSHETRSTQRLLDRVQFYYDTMKDPKPAIGAESRSEKTFPDLHSSMFIGTAGARAFGHGDTLRKAHLSELAHYEDGETVLNGVEDAVPIGGELIIESTPNGEDNILFEKWTRAREGKSSYKTFFFPWWWDEGYTIPRNSEIVIPEDRGELRYTDDELQLVTNHLLTEEQIRWRRWKIGEKGGLFWQEYPEDEVSCWISVGDPVFDQGILNELASNCYNGEYHPEGWTYWIPPVPGVDYILAADSSSGAQEGSYSAALILDNQYRVCATYQGRIDPNTLALTIKKMGIWYNRAKIVIERNFTGYAVLAALVGGSNLDNPGINLGNYPNIYRQRDFLTGKVTNQLGWWTNEQTKEHMRAALRDSLPKLKTWDSNLVRQVRGYRFMKQKITKKLIPTAQTFDDLAICLQIACAVRKIEGGSRGYIGKIPGYTGSGWD